MNNYNQLNDIQKQNFRYALAKKNVSPQKINDIIAYFSDFEEQQKKEKFLKNGFIAVLGLCYYGFLGYIVYFNQHSLIDFIESFRTNEVTSLLHDSTPASAALVGLLFAGISLPMIIYFLSFKSSSDFVIRSKILEFYTFALYEAKGTLNRVPIKINAKFIDSTFNASPLYQAFQNYTEKEGRRYRLIFIPVFIFSLCFTITMLLLPNWVATKEGIIFYSFANAKKEIRPWADVKSIQTACISGGKRKYTTLYTVILKDSTEVTLLNSAYNHRILEHFDNAMVIDAILKAQKTPKSFAQWDDGNAKANPECWAKLKYYYPVSYPKMFAVLGFNPASRQALYNNR